MVYEHAGGQGWLSISHVMSYSHSCDFFQMTFLRLLSKEAHQNMTYTCINSVAWYDNQARNYDKSVRLMGSNDDEFSAIQNKPNVENDGCKFGGRESKTVFNIVTKKRDQVCSLTQNLIDFFSNLPVAKIYGPRSCLG